MSTEPNVLLIMTDQQRGDCLGDEGHPVLLTPNMDNIARNGVRFSRCYSTCPQCMPARRSLLSGQFPFTHNLRANKAGEEWEEPPTLPGALREAGYHTCWVGRSIHQYPKRKRFGFDQMNITDDYFEWLEEKLPAKSHQKGTGNYTSGSYYANGPMHNDWTARPWPYDEALHRTNWTVSEALKFLERRDPSCPFFLAASFIAPHPPLIPPSFYMERYLRLNLPDPVIGDWATPPAARESGDIVAPHKINLTGEALRACRAGYFGLINHVDDQIRRLLNGIDGVGLARDTIVIFTADHGEMLGDHYFWRKQLPYEGAARIPLIISAPEEYQFEKGLILDRPTGLEDIMPTVLDMVGVDIPNTVEGRSLLPLCQNKTESWRSYIHLENATSPTAHHCLTDGKEKYIWFTETGKEQFFDLEEDPQEVNNLNGAVVERDRIEKWRERMVKKLADRPEGFSDGEKLIAGRPYPKVLEDK